MNRYLQKRSKIIGQYTLAGDTVASDIHFLLESDMTISIKKSFLRTLCVSALLSTCGILFSNPYAFIPPDDYVVIAMNTRELAQGMQKFVDPKNPVLKEVMEEIRTTAKQFSNGKLPAEAEVALDESKWKPIQPSAIKVIGQLPMEGTLFVPSMSTPENAVFYAVFSMGPETDLKLAVSELKKESPELEIKNLKVGAYEAVEFGNVRKAIEVKHAKQLADMKKLQESGKLPEISVPNKQPYNGPDAFTLVTMGGFALAGPKELIETTIKKGMGKDIREENPVAKQVLKMMEKGYLFALVATSKSALKDNPNAKDYDWMMGGFGKDKVLGKLKFKDPQMAAQKANELGAQIQGVKPMVQGMGAQMSQGQPFIAKAVDHVNQLLASIDISEEKGVVTLSFANPGLTGLTRILVGGFKAALPMIMQSMMQKNLPQGAPTPMQK